MKKLIFTVFTGLLIFLLLILLAGCCCVVPVIPEPEPEPEPEPCYTLVEVQTVPTTICEGDPILIKGRVWSSLGEDLSYKGIPVELFVDGKYIKTVFTGFCGYFEYYHECAHLLEPCSHTVKAVAQYGDCEIGCDIFTCKVKDCAPSTPTPPPPEPEPEPLTPPPPECGPEGCDSGGPGPDPE